MPRQQTGIEVVEDEASCIISGCLLVFAIGLLLLLFASSVTGWSPF